MPFSLLVHAEGQSVVFEPYELEEGWAWDNGQQYPDSDQECTLPGPVFFHLDGFMEHHEPADKIRVYKTKEGAVEAAREAFAAYFHYYARDFDCE